MVDDNERGFRRALIEASDHFGLDHERLEPLGGMTGRVFGIDDTVLRLSSPETIAHELAAANAASAAVPVPPTVGTFVPTDGGPWAAALIERVDGTVAADLNGVTAERAFTRGLACGRAQAALWTVTAPPAFASIDGKRSLLHLDLHPLNILLGPDDRVTAVIDWTNAGAGSPDYDRARTSAIFRLDPHASGPAGSCCKICSIATPGMRSTTCVTSWRSSSRPPRVRDPSPDTPGKSRTGALGGGVRPADTAWRSCASGPCQTGVDDHPHRTNHPRTDLTCARATHRRTRRARR